MLDLKPFTEYEFQISSKLHLFKGSWSDWSESLRTQTPEEGMCFKEGSGRRGRRDRRGRGRYKDFLGIGSLKYWY